MIRNRTLFFAMLAAIFVMGSTFAFAGGQSESKKGGGVVITYNSPPQWANWAAVLKAFTKKTGIYAPSDNKNSGQTVTALLSEKNHPVADVAYFGIVYGIEAANKGLLQSYEPPGFAQIPSNLKDPQGRWFTVHYGAVAFLCNTQALGNVPVPTSWADLLKPEYKGKIAFLDPSSAAIGYSVISAANLAMGGSLTNWKPGISYLRKLEQNGVQHPKQTATARLVKGEIPILIDADFNGYRSEYSGTGAPIKVVIPKEGTLKIPYAIGLVKGAPHEQNGKKLLDFVLSKQGQGLWAQGYVQPILKIKIPQAIASKMAPQSAYARAFAVNFSQMAQERTKAINIWLNDIAGK